MAMYLYQYIRCLEKSIIPSTVVLYVR